MLLLLALTLLASSASAAYFPYSYTNCGSSSDPIQVLGSSLTPSPILFDQNATVSAKVKIGVALTTANAGKVELSIAKHVGLWVDIPCSVLGTCDLTANFCELGKPNPTVCAILSSLGLPCGCPIAAATYSVSGLSEKVPSPPPSMSWLADGSYRVTVTLYDSSGKRLLCAQVIDSVKK